MNDVDASPHPSAAPAFATAAHEALDLAADALHALSLIAARDDAQASLRDGKSNVVLLRELAIDLRSQVDDIRDELLNPPPE